MAMGKSTHTPAYAAFLELLREARESRELFQSEVAERLGKHQAYVSKCESGDRRIDVIELRELCMAMGFTLEDFVSILETKLKGLR